MPRFQISSLVPSDSVTDVRLLLVRQYQDRRTHSYSSIESARSPPSRQRQPVARSAAPGLGRRVAAAVEAGLRRRRRPSPWLRLPGNDAAGRRGCLGSVPRLPARRRQRKCRTVGDKCFKTSFVMVYLRPDLQR